MEVEKGIVEQHDNIAPYSTMGQSSIDNAIDLVAERKLLRKMDKRIIPLIMALYLFVSP